MGNIVSITVSAGIDYFAGSLTAMLWEWVFDRHDESQGRVMTLVTALIQLGATITTATYTAALLTPGDMVKDNTIGLIGVVFFSLLLSPNLMAKLRATHSTIKNTLLFTDGGFLSSGKKTENVILPEAQ